MRTSTDNKNKQISVDQSNGYIEWKRWKRAKYQTADPSEETMRSEQEQIWDETEKKKIYECMKEKKKPEQNRT